MNRTIDNDVVKRYPCRDYGRLLAAEALPMAKELILIVDLEKFPILSISTNKCQFKKSGLYLFSTREEISKESFVSLECNDI